MAPGATTTVQARRPGSEPTNNDPDDNPQNFYFYFDQPEDANIPADESALLSNYGLIPKNVWTSRAKAKDGRDREPAGGPPLDFNTGEAPPAFNPATSHYAEIFAALSRGDSFTIRGAASNDNDPKDANHNYLLAIRRAKTVQALIQRAFPEKNFDIAIEPNAANKVDWIEDWKKQNSQFPSLQPQDWWRATVTLPEGITLPEQMATATLSRPDSPPPAPPEIPVVDQPPAPPRAPDWFRSAKLKVRIVRDELIVGEIESEVDLQTATESKLRDSGQLARLERESEQLDNDVTPPNVTPPNVRSLESGTPLAEDNPADGITKVRLVVQSDPATGKTSTLIEIGANPADKDGLAMAGWMPGEISSRPEQKDLGLSLLGAYLSFWPLLATLPNGNNGGIEDAVLTSAALALPGTIALLPWFRIERVILYGGEFLKRDRHGEAEAFLLFDVRMDWSVDISIGNTELIKIDPAKPLAVRYKAIGLRFGHRDSADKFSLRPVFDASRGYTIDVAKEGSLQVAERFSRILRVLAARISRTNPTTFEIDLGMAIDLGVVSIDRARVRVYLDGPEGQPIPRPELTALGASVDIKGALVGQGYLEIGDSAIAGQIDLTIRPIELRVSAALEITQLENDDGAVIGTGVYVGISVVLPVGIPLGASGLGIFGFRGIFGMHYQRSTAFGANSATPALAWLEASKGQPHLLFVPSDNGNDDEENNPPAGDRLWVPQLDRWAFGLGILIGTMEGGVLMNLDGTFLLELPGPRILIVMNARILSPPPSVGKLGAGGGILAVIEITREHILIGLIAEYGIPNLLDIRIPVETFFSFTQASNWHIYLGRRSDPITVDVLGIVEGTGYLMLQGDGLAEYKGLSAIEGFAIGIGAAASFRFGGERLYLHIGGSMDAVMGFSPFVLEGVFEVSGELRLFIISIGAHATLFVSVREPLDEDGEPISEREPVDEDGEPISEPLQTYVHGEACGHIDLFFFKLKGCVEIEIGGSPGELPPIPSLVTKFSLQSRSPALAEGTGDDRGIDASLGNGIESDQATVVPDLSQQAPVPIDTIPILSMLMPVQDSNLRFFGEPIGVASGAPALGGKDDGFITRGDHKYRYELTQVTLERIDPADGSIAGPALIGSVAPAVWWLLNDGTEEPNPNAHLALMTWTPTPASKAMVKGELLKESVKNRWGQLCDEAAAGSPHKIVEVVNSWAFWGIGAIPSAVHP